MIYRPLAQANVLHAREALSDCRLCGHECGVDRSQSAAGFCAAPPEGNLFYEQIECAGEAELVPTYALGLSGCNFRCSFCVTGTCSQDASTGQPIDLPAVGGRIASEAARVRSVTLLGGEPSIYLPTALQLAALVPTDSALVWKSNSYASPDALTALEGVIDVFLGDYKFGNAACARRLAAVDNYAEVVQANLRWARKHTRLIVRHLLMPGHLECCFLPVVEWLAREMPDVPLSLMHGFLPAFKSYLHPELMRTVSPDEVEWATKRALEYGLTLAPWTVAVDRKERSAGSTEGRSEIWIDRTGRICMPSLSPELSASLQRLGLMVNL